MARIPSWIIAAAAIVPAVLFGGDTAAQDKYTVQVPGGLAFSEFRGYEDWQVVAVSQTEDRLKVIVANPAMIDAYRAGVPGNGQPFPDGAKMAKIEWNPRQNAEAPFSVRVPDTVIGADSWARMAAQAEAAVCRTRSGSGGMGAAPGTRNRSPR